MKNFRSKILLAAAVAVSAFTGLSAQPYKDASLPVEQRIEDLLSRMTLEEKILQLNQYTLGRNDNANNIGEAVGHVPAEIGSLIYFGDNPVLRNAMQRRAMEESRLGIPVLFGFDSIHGFRTGYPIPLAQGASWNTDLAREACAMSAAETSAAGIDWTFSPMVDVAHDPRWGRVAEGYGEDPYLTSQFCRASVEGYQGGDLAAKGTVAACLKHFVGYGASEAGRDYVPTEISAQTLWDTYLPPFQAGVEAGAATLMSGFNNISGVPASANHYTLTEVVKQMWGHDGFIVSDWDSVKQLINQGYASDGKQAAQLAFNAGVEMDMVDKLYINNLANLLEEGAVSIDKIDDAVRRVLRVKFRLGLFENPYTPEKKAEEVFLLPEYRAVAFQAAVESMVLLKNEGKALPLSSGAKIALIGPLADEATCMRGSWYGRTRPEDVVTILSALSSEYTVNYAKGSEIGPKNPSAEAVDPKEASALIKEALKALKKSDIAVLCLGEHSSWSGENASRASISIPECQMNLLRAVRAEASKSGKKVVLLLSNGRPMDISEAVTLCDAVLEIWQPGVEAGPAVAEILSGRQSPSGRLTMTFPRSVGQVPIYYNRRQSGRRGTQGLYQDIASTPLYEFGYGLSYTEFQYSPLKLVAKMKDGSTVQVSKGKSLPLGEVESLRAEISVKNAGTADSKEVVQWYVSDPYCSIIARPVKELRHFEKRMIAAGNSETFVFDIDPLRDLGFVGGTGSRFLEPGEFRLSAGNSTISFFLD